MDLAWRSATTCARLPITRVIMPSFSLMRIITVSGGSWYLSCLIGWTKPSEITVPSDYLYTQEALYRLVNRAVPVDEVLDVAAVWAEEIVAKAPLSITEIKRLFWHGLNQDFEAHSHHVSVSLANLTRPNDLGKAGSSFFGERRAPEFTGS